MIFSPVWAKMVSDLTLDVALVVSADEKIDDAVGGDDEGNDDNDDYIYQDGDHSDYEIRIFSSYLFVVFNLVFRQVNVQLS